MSIKSAKIKLLFGKRKSERYKSAVNESNSQFISQTYDI